MQTNDYSIMSVLVFAGAIPLQHATTACLYGISQLRVISNCVPSSLVLVNSTK